MLAAHGPAARRRLIVSDTVFSMDGDVAPLQPLLALAERHDALLVVDEAHATGVMGENGKGMTDSYAGKKHMVLADMRGMKPASPKVAEKFGALIGYQRTHGVFFCVHLSDETVTRLQLDRLSRKASPHGKITVDVVSMEEAEAALSEERLKLRME